MFFCEISIKIFISYGTIGAILLAALYHTGLYYFRRTSLLLDYSIYLWSSILFLSCTVCFYPVLETDPVVNVTNHLLFLLSMQLYIRFVMGNVFDITRSGFRIAIAAYKSTFVAASAYLLVTLIAQIFPDKNNPFERMVQLVISVYMLLTTFFLLIHLFFRRSGSFFNLIITGAMCLLIFNVLGFLSHAAEGDDISKTNFLLFLCIGYFIETLFFSTAVGVKLKEELMEKIAAGEKVIEQQHLLLESELDKQTQIVQTREKERKQISRDLHDELSNALAGLKFVVAHMKRNAVNNEEKNSLSLVEDEVGIVYRQARHFMHKLYESADRQNNDLPGFLRSLPEKFSKSGLYIDIAIDEAAIQQHMDVQHQNYSFLIITEALSNIMKYSNAEKVEISIVLKEALWEMQIKDNGRGMIEGVSDGMGLRNISARADEMNGTFNISSSKTGTAIFVTFPAEGDAGVNEVIPL